MTGKEHRVEELLAKNQLVAFVFWQTWCASCRQEAPSLVRAAKQYQGQISFFGVISGPDKIIDNELVVTTAKELRLSYPQIRDKNLALTKKFEVNGTPTIVVLGPGMKVLYNGHRLPNWGKLRG